MAVELLGMLAQKWEDSSLLSFLSGFAIPEATKGLATLQTEVLQQTCTVDPASSWGLTGRCLGFLSGPKGVSSSPLSFSPPVV